MTRVHLHSLAKKEQLGKTVKLVLCSSSKYNLGAPQIMCTQIHTQWILLTVLQDFREEQFC